VYSIAPELWVDLLIWLGAAVLVLAGFAGMIIPALPGPLLLLGGLLMAAWAEDFVQVGMPTILFLSLLCALAMALDFIAGAMGAKRYGASGAAVTGALIGGMVGIFFGPPGLLLGPFAGAMAGELITGRALTQAGLSGWGATLGMLLGVVAKLAIGVMMVGTFVLMRLF
jgi:hypothetical protein